MTMNDPIQTLLTFWFGAPARTAAELERKIVRWFQSGPALDAEIIERFSHLVIQALAGFLDDWSATTEGRLALILLLDQLTRHAFRGTARMYAGDAQALALATEAHDLGLDRRLGVEERIFLGMPLVHAEDVAVLDRAVTVTRTQVDAAPAAVRPALQHGYERVRSYRTIIARYGRFPVRNEALGRKTTGEEAEFLRAWSRRAA
jgi:uncharacterized protein (DUF924 family)